MSAIQVDALFHAMDLLVGRIGYLTSFTSKSNPNVIFNIGNSMIVEIVSMYFNKNKGTVSKYLVTPCLFIFI